MNERCHTNSVPWMFTIGLNKSGFTESTNCVHSWYGVGVTAFIHATELVWPRTFMVRSWCDRGHSWYGVDVTASIHGMELVWIRKVIPRVHCTVEIHLADFSFFSFVNDEKIHQISYIRTQPWPMTCKAGGNLVKRRQNCMGVNCMDDQQTRPLVNAGSYTACCKGGGPWWVLSTKSTLRSWCNLVKWPYGVKKISIKWLLPVKVTLVVIKRHPKVFCWSCDEDPLKWEEKKLRSFQFVITDRMSLLSPLSSNGRSIPLNIWNKYQYQTLDHFV